MTRCLTVAVLTAAMVWPACGQVLCVGDNGHVAIEAAHPVAGCLDGTASTMSDDHAPAIDASRRDCTDFSLGTRPIARPDQDRMHSDLAETGDAPLVAVLDPIQLDSPPSHVLIRGDESPGHVHHLLVVRSVVLLI